MPDSHAAAPGAASPGEPTSAKRKVVVLTTGGTIEHRSSNGVAVMEFAPSALAAQLGLSDLAVEFVPLFAKGSMEVVPEDWLTIADAVVAHSREQPAGIVVLHGTDTLHYTAAALSFVLRNLGCPVVLTGSMRPGGDPGSDAPANLRDAITVAAAAAMAEVCIVFSADRQRTRGMIIRGTRGRKLHSLAIDAFASVNASPLGFIEHGAIALAVPVRPRRASAAERAGGFAAHVPLVKITPGTTPEGLTRCLQGAAGAVVEGTGIGHIRTALQKVIADFAKPVVMTTQTVYGGEALGLYEADRPILGIANLIPAGDMLSETAQVKLMWALTRGGDIREIMRANIAGEIGEGSA